VLWERRWKQPCLHICLHDKKLSLQESPGEKPLPKLRHGIDDSGLAFFLDEFNRALERRADFVAVGDRPFAVAAHVIFHHPTPGWLSQGNRVILWWVAQYRFREYFENEVLRIWFKP
jgi:hypothetical protein